MNEAQHIVLGADVGGSTARFAIVSASAETWAPLRLEQLPTAAVGSFRAALAHLLQSRFEGLDAACIAVAGPVRDDRVRLTNLPWEIDVASVAKQLSLPPNRVRLINDLEAIAWAIPTFTKEQLCTLQVGQPGPGNAALLAAGTGLGEAGVVWDGDTQHPFASEGGHADFAPRDDVEWGFACQLVARWGHASLERVVSGPGLLALYRYLLQLRKATPPREVGERLRAGEGAAVVTDAALAGECAIAAEAVERFAGLLGAEAGNLALKLLARGGVYVGGGIPPKLLPLLPPRLFVDAFLAKGRMRPLLESFPVHVIIDETAGLRGATVVASRLAAARRGRRPGSQRIPARKPGE